VCPGVKGDNEGGHGENRADGKKKKTLRTDGRKAEKKKKG